jgi:hypothetical protein
MIFGSKIFMRQNGDLHDEKQRQRDGLRDGILKIRGDCCDDHPMRAPCLHAPQSHCCSQLYS